MVTTDSLWQVLPFADLSDNPLQSVLNIAAKFFSNINFEQLEVNPLAPFDNKYDSNNNYLIVNSAKCEYIFLDNIYLQSDALHMLV